ncbi:MAG: hypothetical protein ACRDA5_16045 [Clostridium sp.]
MKKNNILIICTVIISSLIVGCSDKSIVLNENTKIEQSNFDSNLVVKEKEFKLKSKSGISFEPSFIREDGIYGLAYKKDNYNKLSFEKVLKRVLDDGTIEDSKYNLESLKNEVRTAKQLPFVVEENLGTDIVYKDYFSGKEKILLNSVSSSRLNEDIINPMYIIKNSPYAVVLESSNNSIGKFEKTINIIDIDTGEKFRKKVNYEEGEWPPENFYKMEEIYFYSGEKGVVYSLSYFNGSIMKLTLNNGKIEEEEYDKISNVDSSITNRYEIYTNGVETRIIVTVQSPFSNIIEKQLAYKVSSKEVEVLYDSKSKQGNIVNEIEMLPNEYMLCEVNKEYVLVKFDTEGIKLVYKLNLSGVGNWEYENIQDVKVATNSNGSQILIKFKIKNSNTNITSEGFKMYEIENK